jgi:hypothetical protein
MFHTDGPSSDMIDISGNSGGNAIHASTPRWSPTRKSVETASATR